MGPTELSFLTRGPELPGRPFHSRSAAMTAKIAVRTPLSCGRRPWQPHQPSPDVIWCPAATPGDLLSTGNHAEEGWAGQTANRRRHAQRIRTTATATA